MRTTIRSITLIATLGSVLFGCSLVTTFDRSKIKKDAGAADAGMDATSPADTGVVRNDATVPPMDAGQDKDAGGKPKDAGSMLTKKDAGKDASAEDGGDVDSGVECRHPADCAGTDTECHMRTCGAGACGISNVLSGHVLSQGQQTAGECKNVVCDGSGSTKVVNKGSGVSCSSGVCDGSGSCVACVMPSDCGADTECKMFTCTSHVCGSTPKQSSGFVLNVQNPNDCIRLECDSSGGVMPVTDMSDIPATDNNPCTDEICQGQTPMHKSSPVTMSCGGTNHCDGSGNCVGCNQASDCPGTDTLCHQRTCNSHVCGTNNVAAGIALGSQVAGDCQEAQCDGSGNPKSVNLPSDLPADEPNECTTEACSGTITAPAHTPRTNAHCANDTKICDSSGVCGGCVVDAACGSMICIDQACATAGSLSNVNVTPASLVAGAKGNVTITFTTQNKWPANGLLDLVFPSGFDASGATFVSTNAVGSLTIPNASALGLTLARSGGVETALAANVSVVLGNVRVPQVSGTTGTFAVATQTSAGVDIDSGSDSGVAITPGALTSTSLLLNSSAASAVDQATISFKLANPWPKNGVVTVLFPAGFDLTSVAVVPFMVSGADGNFAITASNQTLVIKRDNSGTVTAAGTAIDIIIDTLTNPAATGPTGMFTITTETASSVIIDTGDAAEATIN